MMAKLLRNLKLIRVFLHIFRVERAKPTISPSTNVAHSWNKIKGTVKLLWITTDLIFPDLITKFTIELPYEIIRGTHLSFWFTVIMKAALKYSIIVPDIARKF